MSIPLSPQSGLAQAGNALLARIDAVLRANTAMAVREDAASAAAYARRNASSVVSQATSPGVSEADLSKAREILAAGQVRRAKERQAAIAASWRRAHAANNLIRADR